LNKKLLIIILIALLISLIGCSPQEYEVKIKLKSEKAGKIVGEGTYKAGEEIGLAALPNQGYEFANWTINEEVISKDNIHKMTINEDLNLTANFDKIRRNKFAYVNINDGLDVRIGPFYEGEEISLKAETIEGYEFLNWEIDGENFSEEKKIEFNIDARDIKVRANYENLAKEVDELIEKADKAMGEKRWRDAGEYLLEVVESDQIKHSKYNENIEKFFSTFAMSEENIIQALIDEEITTKEDIENVNWENIVPEEPKLDVLERKDEEIYEWFYKYFEFYGRIHSGSGIKNITESIWYPSTPLIAEEAYNEVKKTVLKYSENPFFKFLMVNRKLIDNGIFAYQVGGAEKPFIYDVFTMDDSKFLTLDKEENKLIFEFKYTLETDWPDVSTDSDGKFKIKVEIHEKEDGTFRVGETSFIFE
jgi:predicted transcriptional regulator